jgi:hypothetical protein
MTQVVPAVVAENGRPSSLWDVPVEGEPDFLV